MVSLDTLLLISKEGAEERYRSIREKRKMVCEAFRKKEQTGKGVTVRSVENTAPLYFIAWFNESSEIIETYGRMRASIQTDNYPTYRNMDNYNIENNADVLWRAYTFIRGAQLLDLRNYKLEKRKGSVNLFRGLFNCTDALTVLEELANRGQRHPQLMECKQIPRAEALVGGAKVYNLTTRAAPFIEAFRLKLIDIDPDFGKILRRYDTVLHKVIKDFGEASLIAYHPQLGERATDDILTKSIQYQHLHIRGKPGLNAARQIHNNYFEVALENLK